MVTSFAGRLSAARTSHTVLLKRPLASRWEKWKVPVLRLPEVQAPASERVSPRESGGSPLSITVGKDGLTPGWVRSAPRTPC